MLAKIPQLWSCVRVISFVVIFSPDNKYIPVDLCPDLKKEILDREKHIWESLENLEKKTLDTANLFDASRKNIFDIHWEINHEEFVWQYIHSDWQDSRSESRRVGVAPRDVCVVSGLGI